MSKEVKIEFSSTDVTTAAAAILYDGDHNVITLSDNERLVIDCLTISAATVCVTAQVFDDKDDDGVVDAGELLLGVATTDASQSVSFTSKAGVYCSIGTIPKVIANTAGQVYVTGSGYVMIA